MRKGQDIAIELPGLYLVHQNIPGKKADRHSHAEHLLFIPLQGEIKVIIDAGALNCGPGRMIYLPPETEHSFDSSSLLGERLIALIKPTVWRKLKAFKSAPSILPANQLCKEILFYLLLHPTAKPAHKKALVEVFLQTLSGSLESATAPAPGNSGAMEHLESRASDPRLRAALKKLHESAARGEPSSIPRIARDSGLSVRNLTRLFTKELGMAPKRVLIHYRIEKAKEVLISGGTVTQAAFDAGYSSLSQFITVFRQITGQLPSELSRLGQKQ